MHNLTLVFLAAGWFGRGALVSTPRQNVFTSFECLGVSVQRSFSHFFFGNSKRLLFDNSRFSRFLEAPIWIDGDIVKEGERFSRTLLVSGESAVVSHCAFVECHSRRPGAAIHCDASDSKLVVSDSTFSVCRCLGKGGAIYAKMASMAMSRNCFQLCKCGKENGDDGSTVYAFSKTGINTSYVSALKCPEHGDPCWYGIIILCNGVLDSRNINISNSDVEFIAGLAHFRPDYGKSTLLWYTSVNQINGNALAFIDFTFKGEHRYGSLVNDTSKTGIFYVQNTTTTLQDYYFINNRGPITYACVGDSKAYFENCFFSQGKTNLGVGWGDATNCHFNQKARTTLLMMHLNTAFCDGNIMDTYEVFHANTEHQTTVLLISGVLFASVLVGLATFSRRTLLRACARKPKNLN